MATIAWISAASVLGGVASVLLAGLFAFTARASWVHALVSYAIGALLGAVFLNLLPHAFSNTAEVPYVAGTILAGILGFFVLEKLVLWRHCHLEDCEVHTPHEETGAVAHAHGGHGATGGNARGAGGNARGALAHIQAEAHDNGRSGMMIVIGDSFHNFVDGILIAAAFLESTQLGIVTAVAVIAHEIPQEIGDFIILLHSGYSKTAAFALNLLSSLAMLVGALLAYFALQTMQQWISTVIALAAASMIYVAVADLIPGLHKRPEIGATVQQVSLIALGVFTIWLVGILIGHGR
ncbi:MAG: ZIP family metal transporter [Betaproteobacteria bacterium]|nr:ZIP family metal transporter [Betaproteobacteria bacterium]